MRRIDNDDIITKLTTLQAIGEDKGIANVQEYLNSSMQALTSSFPVKLTQSAYLSIIYSFLNTMLNPSLLDDEVEQVLNDIKDALSEVSVECTVEQLQEVRACLKKSIQDSSKVFVKPAKPAKPARKVTKTVSTADDNKKQNNVTTDTKKVGTLPLAVANKTEKNFREQCVNLFSVYYVNPEDNYIYIIGRTIEKRWPVPTIKTMYREVETGMQHYVLELGGKEYCFSREMLNTGKYKYKLPVSLLDSPTFANTYANCITKIAETAITYPMLERTGLHEYHDVRDNTTKYGFMLPTGDMLTVDGSYYPFISLKKEMDDERKMSEEDKTRYNKYVERAKSVTNKDIANLQTYLKEVSKNGIALILECHDSRAFFNSLRNAEYKATQSILLWGPPRSGKTELSMFNRGLAYPYMYKGVKDASFSGTITSIEIALDAIQDLPTIVDDLSKPKSETDTGMKGKEKVIDACVRSLNDNKPVKERANIKLELQKAKKARSLLVFTSEYYPDMLQDSTFRRLLAIKMEEGSVNLDMLVKHASKMSYVQFAIGRKIQLQVLEDIATYGKDGAVLMYQKEYNRLKKVVEKKIEQKWKEKQTSSIPHIVGSLIEISADILVGGWMLDRVCKVTTFVEDTTEHLVEALYKHLLKMLNQEPNEEGETAVEYALINLLEGISVGRTYKVGNSSEKLRIADYKQTSLPATNSFTKEESGYDGNNAKEYKVAIYVDEEKEKAYVTPEGREAMLQILGGTGQYRDTTTDKALSQLMKRENWLVEVGEGRYLAKKMKKGVPRCLVLSLDRVLAIRDTLFSKDQSENVKTGEDVNVTPEETLQEKRSKKHSLASKIQEIDAEL